MYYLKRLQVQQDGEHIIKCNFQYIVVLLKSGKIKFRIVEEEWEVVRSETCQATQELFSAIWGITCGIKHSSFLSLL